MRNTVLTFIGFSALLAALAGPAALSAAGPERVDYDRDILPILSDNCFTCHGFDEKTRIAGLRLDTQEGAFAKARSGKPAIVPGKPDESTLLQRVTAANALRMPPASTGKTLTQAQVEKLRAWISQGAPYTQHWAFKAPIRPRVPQIRNPQSAIRNPIDSFVQARLQREGLTPSPEADRRTLIRRLSLDLTGLPPTVAEVQAFLGDTQPGAYERLVDRLLASPHYGERMALQWLDLARYADTHGYHIDSHRDMWPWRDWVIRAFNKNLPYDQFVVEQLAGDLLPNPTRDQIVATGFNRNHPINFEGGAIPEEYHAAYVFDRVDTTSTAFMGLTMKCAQCHDHKYDPLTQKEFYGLYAYFHNVNEVGLDGTKGNARPFMQVPSPEQERERAAITTKLAGLDAATKARAAAVLPEQTTWETRIASSAGAFAAVTAGLAAHYGLDEKDGDRAADALSRQPGGTLHGAVTRADGKFGGAYRFDGSSYVDLGPVHGFDRADRFSYGAWVHPTDAGAGTVISRMDDAAKHRGWDLYLQDGKAFVHLVHEWEGNAIRVNTKNPMPLNQWRHVFVTYDGSSKAAGVKIYVDGQPQPLDVTHDKLTGTIRTEKPAFIGQRNPGARFKGLIDEVRVYDRDLSAEEVAQLAGFDSVRQVLAVAPEKRTPEQKSALTKYYLETQDGTYRSLTADLTTWKKRQADLEAAIPTTMVMEELPKPRETFILTRGEYDKRGEKVTPHVPEVLPPLPADAPPNRLALARWLVDPRHPLTARVAVNRYWQMLFGTGLVETTENFGIQGDRPSHPELLAWLSVEFVESGWDIKRLLKLIVTSAAYRQDSAASEALLTKDPDNRTLARGPRSRLPAEFVRDQALAVSGLLVPKIGGPAVKPYQPPGLWEEIAFGGNFTAQTYVQDHGEALYRRSMYTFWKRTCPPPSLQTFDAPEREVCVVRRSRSNTPLQALVLMNDPTYVEASRHFAERIITEVAALPADRVRYAYRLALSRLPENEEIRVLLAIYEEQLAHYRKDPEAAKKLLSVGESPRNEKLDLASHAAWTTVCSAIFNLDEMITKN